MDDVHKAAAVAAEVLKAGCDGLVPDETNRLHQTAAGFLMRYFEAAGKRFPLPTLNEIRLGKRG